MNKLRGVLLAAGLATAAIIGCNSLPTLSGGGGIETVSLAGSVVYPGSGQPATHALVRLRPALFLMDTATPSRAKIAAIIKDAVTDSSGRFTIDSINPGDYFIEVNDGKSNAALLKCSLPTNHPAVELPKDTLRPMGSIKGALASLPAGAKDVFVQIYGLDRVARVDATTGSYSISDIPRGTYTLRVVASSPSTPKELPGVRTVSGASTDLGTVDFLPLSTWQSSRTLLLNTSSSGAGVTGDVTGFPVLVRLNAANFDFSRAQSDGLDLRFAKPDGTPLPFEIERWDSAAQYAEVWVRVDTVYGNNGTQSITMLWNNPAATAASNSAAVFDTSIGFQGVWHLAQASGAIAKDATVNRYDGTPSSAVPAAVAGAIGGAQEFDGVANYIQMKGTAAGKLNLPENGSYSVSAWVYADTLYAQTRTIMCKGDYQYNLDVFWSNDWEFAECKSSGGWDVSRSPATVRRWTLITGVRYGSRQYLFVDGICTDSTYQLNSHGDINSHRSTTEDVAIGNAPGLPNYFFNGKIDEVRISNIARGEDWIKLCYMNQRADDALVEFK